MADVISVVAEHLPYRQMANDALAEAFDAAGLPHRGGSIGWSRLEVIAALENFDNGLVLTGTPGSENFQLVKRAVATES